MPQPDRALAGGRRVADALDQVLNSCYWIYIWDSDMIVA